MTVCLPSLARRAKTGLELGEQGQGEPLEADSRKRDPTEGAQKKKGKQMEEWTVKERYKLNEGTLAEIRLICFTTVLSYLQSAKRGLQEDCLDVFDHL